VVNALPRHAKESADLRVAQTFCSQTLDYIYAGSLRLASARSSGNVAL